MTQKHLDLVTHSWDGYASPELRAIRQLHDEIESLVRQEVETPGVWVPLKEIENAT